MEGWVGINPRDWAEKAKRKKKKVTQEIVKEIFLNVVNSSPVQTGRFKGNWFPSTHTSSLRTIEEFDLTGFGSISRIENFSKTISPGDKFFLTNNLPYGIFLERGSSKKAPYGMVALTVMAAPVIAKRVVKRIAAEP